MSHHCDRLSAEEVLLICCLVLTTLGISLSFNVKSKGRPDRPLTHISLGAAASLATSKADGELPNPVNGSNNVLSATDSPADVVLAPTSGNAKPDGGVRPAAISASYSYNFDARVASSEIFRITENARLKRRGEIQVSKSVYVDGMRVGNLDVTVSAQGDLIFKSTQLKALLAKPGLEVWSASGQGLGNGTISFQALRQRGIFLRYSTQKDGFEIAS